MSQWPIAELIPHAADMILIDEVISFGAEDIETRLTVRPGGLFNQEDGSLPAWVGVDRGEAGYAVVMIEKVQPADTAETGAMAQVRSQYAGMWAQAEADAYYAALRKRYKVEITGTAKVADDAAPAASK